MFKRILWLISLIFFSSFGHLLADTGIKLLLNSVRQVGHGVGVAGWFIRPNVADNSNKWLITIGPAKKIGHWSLEVMIGSFVQNKKATPLFDVRFECDQFAPIRFWSNLEWVNPARGGEDEALVYIEGKYWVVPKVFALGVESENLFFDGKDDIASFGGQITFVFGIMSFTGAHQIHLFDGPKERIRVVLNLP